MTAATNETNELEKGIQDPRNALERLDDDELAEIFDVSVKFEDYAMMLAILDAGAKAAKLISKCDQEVCKTVDYIESLFVASLECDVTFSQDDVIREITGKDMLAHIRYVKEHEADYERDHGDTDQ